MGPDNHRDGVHPPRVRRVADNRLWRGIPGRRADQDLRRAPGSRDGHLVHLDGHPFHRRRDHHQPLHRSLSGDETRASRRLLRVLAGGCHRGLHRDRRHAQRGVDAAYS